MSEINFEERIETLEALIVKVTNEVNKLRTQDELGAVREQIFDTGITDLRNRIAAIRNNLAMVMKIIEETNG